MADYLVIHLCPLDGEMNTEIVDAGSGKDVLNYIRNDSEAFDKLKELSEDDWAVEEDGDYIFAQYNDHTAYRIELISGIKRTFLSRKYNNDTSS